MTELPKPPNLDQDPEATEVLRAWVVNNQLECSLFTGAFEDPGTWGMLLVDLIRNVAQAMEEQDGKDAQETVQRILSVFEEELNAECDDEDCDESHSEG